MFKFKKIRDYENLHIVMWLLKDTCWVLLLKVPAILMIIPTIAVAFHITWLRKHIISDLFHNLAVCFWISANSVWMIGELYFDDELRPVATVLFIAGLVTVSIYYFVIFPKNKGNEN